MQPGKGQRLRPRLVEAQLTSDNQTNRQVATTSQLLQGHVRFGALKKSDDLLIGKSCDLHIRNSPKFATLLPSP